MQTSNGAAIALIGCAGFNRRMKMKINYKKVSVAAIGAAVLLAAAAVVVFSQQPQGAAPAPPPGFGFGRGPGAPGAPPDGFGPLGPFTRDLNLTVDQQNAIKEISDSFRESTQALHEQMRALRESQTDPMSVDFNEATFRASAEARAKIQVELEVAHAKMMSQIASILTAEQKAQLAARHEEMRRTGPPPPPPGGPIN